MTTNTRSALIEAQAGLDGDTPNRHLARVADVVGREPHSDWPIGAVREMRRVKPGETVQPGETLEDHGDHHCGHNALAWRNPSEVNHG